MALLALAASLVAAHPARAATFTVTRTNSAGLGTLRAAIQSANAAAGPDTIVFAIPTTDGGYNPATGVFTITISPVLPAITGPTIIDGTTQAAAIGNTNPGTLGAGGTVGVDGLPLPMVDRPEIQILDGSTRAIGLDVQASNVTIRGLAIYGFGAIANNDASANVRVGAAASNVLIELNVIGASATSFTDPGGAARSVGDNVRSLGADNGTVRNNLIGFSAGKGLGLNAGSNGWLVAGNEIRGNGVGSPDLDAVDIGNGSGGATVRGNLLIASAGVGLDMNASSGNNRAENNTITGNGLGPGAAEQSGTRLYGNGNVIDRNVITGNGGAGIMVTQASTGNVITRNSTSANGGATNQIGIDLLAPADNQNLGTAPFVTPNDAGDGDAGGNGRLNFPVLTAAMLGGGSLTLTGFARPGSAIELFVAAPDPSGFGEGMTWVLTLAEGSGADLDAGTGTYTNPVNSLNQGTDTTNLFRFSIAIPPGVAAGTVLTSTATLGGNTSEFSGNVTVGTGPTLTLLKAVAPAGPAPPGTDLGYTVTFANTGGSPASTVVLTDPIPANTDFQVGSPFGNMGTSGLVMSVSYSDDGGATWTYVPVSGGGAAPPGYDRVVTHIRFAFSGSLGATAPANQAQVGFGARIR